MSEPRTSRVLRSLPRDKAFYFFTSIGNYTGESSASLDEFVKKILKVNVKSLEFHLYRGDFERWIAGTLEDKDLAFKVKELKALKRIGMDLRDRLYLAVSKHFENLKKTNTTSVESSLMKPKNTSVTFWKPQPKGTVETKPQE